MAKWKGITAEELIMLRKIERINYQLRATVKEFGMQSRLYNQYDNLLTSTRKNTLADGGFVRESSSGILQLKADKRSIREYLQYSSYEKGVNRLLKVQTVGAAKEAMIKAYTKRTGIEAKTRKERQAVFIAQKKLDDFLFAELDRVLFQYYKLEDELGKGREFASHDNLRAVSSGYWSSEDDLQEMLRIAKKELDSKQHKIKKDYEDYLGGL